MIPLVSLDKMRHWYSTYQQSSVPTPVAQNIVKLLIKTWLLDLDLVGEARNKKVAHLIDSFGMISIKCRVSR